MNIRYFVLKNISKIRSDNIFGNYQRALSWDNLSRKKIRERQRELLKKILIHSYKNIPYYHKVFNKCGLFIKGGLSLSKFPNVPILTKDIIREESKDLVTYVWEKHGGEKNTSGGSTGQPVEFIQDQNYKAWNFYANKLYFNHTLGKYIGQREINLWGSERDIYRGNLGLKESLINYLYNRKFLNSFRLSDSKKEKFIDVINSFKPKSIWTYVESIYELARFIEEKNIDIYSPELIISTAGTLYPEFKSVIEKAFKTKVYNQYGSREVGPIACQCKYQDKLHVFPWTHFIEILGEDGREVDVGEEGDIVITLLRNYSMPLIRYKIGDRAVKGDGKCSCGRNTADIKSVTGRTIEHFINLKGEEIHGQYFIHQFYYKDWVKKFQVVQIEKDLVENRIVVYKKPNSKDLENIREKEKLVMGDRCRIEFKIVDEIKPTKSGKYLYTISKRK